ncbi:LPS export ABC transporter ATP-binding protein [Cerasicoccus arenae]|uniref:ABC transporter ATP-binding protein n=1 Tax=Cerasicoccus arenae TaxID=424488 RepID=A0A8J3DCA7_9BACT|nr:LPS export ABC transporter ATP-binding protein [Cerasicoccus arenae]MBK1858421.1 LPS export ABC transporter ATP-binding protein [Cerasicoccus arenae]GHC02452.1 ABC transporter ATP-binding protein [Cerasicoccus arenae]
MEDPEPISQPTAAVEGGAIQTQGLVKSYGRREVVCGVDLRVNAGEIVGLLGPNGAGKTTTFYMIVGLVPATRGAVFLDDRDMTKLPMYRRARLGLGYLPQEASVFRKLTVYDNILAVVQTLPVPRKERHDFVMMHLEELKLDHLAKQKAYTLSGGERRRLEITRAMVARPRFMLLDEPFSGVDPKSVDEVQDIILGLKSKDIGILITDHNVRETLKIVDRAYLIHEGKVLSEGTSDFLVNDEKSREYYLGRGFTL